MIITVSYVREPARCTCWLKLFHYALANNASPMACLQRLWGGYVKFLICLLQKYQDFFSGHGWGPFPLINTTIKIVKLRYKHIILKTIFSEYLSKQCSYIFCINLYRVKTWEYWEIVDTEQLIHDWLRSRPMLSLQQLFSHELCYLFRLRPHSSYFILNHCSEIFCHLFKHWFLCTERKISTCSAKYEDGDGCYLNKTKRKRKIPLQQLSVTSHSKIERVRSSSSSANLMAKKLVIRMLMVIVILFFLCWTPIFSVNAWRAFDTTSADQRLSGAPISFIHLLSYTSACVNPIIYCFMNNRFRMGFLATFTCCAKQKPPVIRGEVGDEEEGKTTRASLSKCSYTHMNASAPPWAASEEAINGLQKFKYLSSGLGKWLGHQLNMI